MTDMKSVRRDFVKNTVYSALATALFTQLPSEIFSKSKAPVRIDLELYSRLLKQWCDALIQLQGKDKSAPETYGGFMCPVCGFIHGRSAEAAFPLLYMADQTKDQKYLDAALQVYEWGERNVSKPDGSWINDVKSNPWQGITVFGASALAESLKHHSHLLDSSVRDKWLSRLKKACDFLYGFITKDTSNINYPLCAAYPLALGGKLLGDQRYIDRGKELSQLVYSYLTPEAQLIYGELKPRTKSARGYYPVDISYNVEETLPTLTLYALEMQDRKLLDTVSQSWKTHIQFMLSDGAWDDSFGTRNHKWTYWGSRNSDGCQAGLALLGARDPVFAEAAYRNALLLERCTHNGILYGGPMYVSHGVKPCIHHNFAHAKSLASALNDKTLQQQKFIRTKLPREKSSGVKTFNDIGTNLVSVGNWRATITGNDCEYAVSPHASGGSISLLYHENMGLILTDSLFPELKLRERSNMQGNEDTLQLLLTPRLEMLINNIPYRSSRDLSAVITTKTIKDGIQVNVSCRLMSPDLKDAPQGGAFFSMEYVFTASGVQIIALAKNIPTHDELAFYLPVVSRSDEKVSLESGGRMIVNKAKGSLKIATSGILDIIGNKKRRVFSQSPGVEAIPLRALWDVNNSSSLKISITAGA